MKKIIVSCLVLSVAFTSSCSSSGSMSKADKKFAKAEYENAIQLYQEDIKKGKDVANANFKVAEAYRMSNRLPLSETYYKAAIDAGLKKEEAQFYYGMPSFICVNRPGNRYRRIDAEFPDRSSFQNCCWPWRRVVHVMWNGTRSKSIS